MTRTTHRAGRLALRLLALVLLVLIACVPAVISTDVALAPAATAGPASDGPPPGAPGADFPVLPKRCYDPYAPTTIDRCRILRYGKRSPMVVLWGDSHAWQYLPAVRKEARKHRVSLVLFEGGGCPPSLLPAARAKFACDRLNRSALQFVRHLRKIKRPVRVIISAWWVGYREGYQRMQRGEETEPYRLHIYRTAHNRMRPLFLALGRAKVPFDMVGVSGSVPDDAPACARGDDPYGCRVPRSIALRMKRAVRVWQLDIANAVPGKHRSIDTSSAYCDKVQCYPREHGRTTFYDDYHLGAKFARTLSPFFAPTIRQIAKRR